jgi:DNA-binding NarL/FixJ family response regulator
MNGFSIRVLVVEDHEIWRSSVSMTIAKQRELEIIGQVSDGLVAVEQARQLQPDLILLDIGLPRLHGIEAARQIRRVSPNSKILFVSEHRSPDIVEEAMRTGAMGYVLKSDAPRELLTAIRAVLNGNGFASASVSSPTSQYHTQYEEYEYK